MRSIHHDVLREDGIERDARAPVQQLPAAIILEEVLGRFGARERHLIAVEVLHDRVHRARPDDLAQDPQVVAHRHIAPSLRGAPILHLEIAACGSRTTVGGAVVEPAREDRGRREAHHAVLVARAHHACALGRREDGRVVVAHTHHTDAVGEVPPIAEVPDDGAVGRRARACYQESGSGVVPGEDRARPARIGIPPLQAEAGVDRSLPIDAHRVQRGCRDGGESRHADAIIRGRCAVHAPGIAGGHGGIDHRLNAYPDGRARQGAIELP